jgi:hypothetical protein
MSPGGNVARLGNPQVRALSAPIFGSAEPHGHGVSALRSLPDDPDAVAATVQRLASTCARPGCITS